MGDGDDYLVAESVPVGPTTLQLPFWSHAEQETKGTLTETQIYADEVEDLHSIAYHRGDDASSPNKLPGGQCEHLAKPRVMVKACDYTRNEALLISMKRAA